MPKTKDFLQSNFMMLCFGAFLVLLYPILVFPKGELELLINQHHSLPLDIFFKYITYLGDGILMAILLIALLFYNYQSAIITIFSIVFQTIFVTVFKRLIFSGLERPMAFFPTGTELNFVDGVEIHGSNTFPSGHTITGFALCAILFLVIKNKGILWPTLLFILAFLVGFSRVYLLQHFVVDVYFGGIFGLLSVVFSLYLLPLIFKSDQLEYLGQYSLRNAIRKSNN